MARDVVELLMQDHRDAEQMVRELIAEVEPRGRRDLADAIIGHLVRHAVAEEAIVYPVMRERLPDGEQAVEHDLQEHRELVSVMKKMEAGETGGPDFFELVGRLQSVLSDHIADEEGGQFPALRARLDQQTLVGMGTAVQALKAVAPTRPHPHAPQSMLFHLTVGPGVGLVDRLHDALAHKTQVYSRS